MKIIKIFFLKTGHTDNIIENWMKVHPGIQSETIHSIRFSNLETIKEDTLWAINNYHNLEPSQKLLIYSGKHTKLVLKDIPFKSVNLNEIKNKVIEIFGDVDTPEKESLIGWLITGKILNDVAKDQVKHNTEQKILSEKPLDLNQQKENDSWVADINLLKMEHTPQKIQAVLAKISPIVRLKEQVGKKYLLNGVKKVEIIFPEILSYHVGNSWFSNLVIRDIETNQYSCFYSMGYLIQRAVEIKE